MAAVQWLLQYFPVWLGGLALPAALFLVVLGLPYLEKSSRLSKIARPLFWFSLILYVALTVIGVYIHGRG